MGNTKPAAKPLTATQTARLAKITEAGTLDTIYLNGADHDLKRLGLIDWTSEPLARPTRKSDYLYHLTAIR